MDGYSDILIGALGEDVAMLFSGGSNLGKFQKYYRTIQFNQHEWI